MENNIDDIEIIQSDDDPGRVTKKMKTLTDEEEEKIIQEKYKDDELIQSLLKEIKELRHEFSNFLNELLNDIDSVESKLKFN